MRKIYTEEILMFDEDGDDWTPEYEEFDRLEIYMVEHPEMFEVRHISNLLVLFDDCCFSEHLMEELANIVSKIIIYYKDEGMHAYFSNIYCVPQKGQFHGKFMIIKNLIYYSYKLFEQCLLKESAHIKDVVKIQIQKIENPDMLEKKQRILDKLEN